jgi:thiol-disulfide isomerase/thioredoxin
MKSLVLLSVSLMTALASSAVGQQPPPRTEPLKLPAGITLEQLADPKEAARVADLIDQQHPAPQSEGVRMLVAILRGSQLNGTDGWFGPAQTRMNWDWLTQHCRVAKTAKAIPQEQFRGPVELFDRLDRDGDGEITPSDLDWSDRNPYVMQANLLNRLFRRFDTSGDGRLTRAELDGLFKQIAKEKDHFTAEDFRSTLIPRGRQGFAPGDAPTIPVLVRGLFAGEIGSISEGPSVGDLAPDFRLTSTDGQQTIILSELIGKRPIVLVFGNFTCGPFRSLYPDVEAVYRRHKDQATFVMVYVREAHPTDGWKMDSNGRFGVAVKQPTTYPERVEVCEQFRKKLTPELTVVVDEITDPVGTAYSGMPARLYVIDQRGKVAYKSGRGPFGFKPGEMEQALVMTLLESQTDRR